MTEERMARKDLRGWYELNPIELIEWTCPECRQWLVASYPSWAPPMCRNLGHKPRVMNQGPSARVQWDKRAPWEPARTHSDGPLVTLVQPEEVPE